VITAASSCIGQVERDEKLTESSFRHCDQLYCAKTRNSANSDSLRQTDKQTKKQKKQPTQSAEQRCVRSAWCRL